MPAFPVLYVSSSVVHKPKTISPDGDDAFDPTLRSQTEGGYVVTRTRCTRVPRVWGLHYVSMSDANVETLRTFVGTVKRGAVSFTWPHPVSGVTYTVRFDQGGVRSKRNNPDDNDVDMTLEEV